MDFMDGVKTFPEDLVKKKTSERRRVKSQSEASQNSSEGQKEDIIDPEKQIIIAEKKLAWLLKQSNENAFQQDVAEELPPEFKRFYDNPDLIKSETDEMATIEQKILERNRHIAVLDELKGRKQDANDQKIKYQYRVLIELLQADKLVKKIRAT